MILNEGLVLIMRYQRRPAKGNPEETPGDPQETVALSVAFGVVRFL